MKAMLFAAGLGTRLKPLTDTMPKALVPVANRPLLEHVLLKLKDAGFNEVVINIHHFAEQIINFLASVDNFGMDIQLSDERGLLLETGGAIKKARPLLGNREPFLIHNVDILSNADLAQLYHTHITSKAAATLLVSERTSSRQLLFEQGRLAAWQNINTGEMKPQGAIRTTTMQPLAFSGIHVFSPELLSETDRFPDKFSIIDFYLDCCQRYNILSYQQKNLRLLDVGKIDSLETASQFVQ